MKKCLLCHLMAEPLPPPPPNLIGREMAPDEARALTFFFFGQFTGLNPRMAAKVAKGACQPHREAGALLETMIETMHRGAL